MQVSQLADVGSDYIPIGIELNMEPTITIKSFPKRWLTNCENLREFFHLLAKSRKAIVSPNNNNYLPEDLTG